MVSGLVVCLLFAPLLPAPASADRGGIPFNGVRYREDAQNAIAAWNGREEILILSTDLGASENGKLLEMLPLPAAPSSIAQGDREQFETFVKIFNSKLPPARKSPSGFGDTRAAGNGTAVTIIFQQSIGVHDLTVAQVNDCAHFADWVRGFATASGLADYSIGPEMNLSVREHLERGISYFVFDVVEVGTETRSLDPLVYRFNTSFLYYPMAITAASFGNNGGHYPIVNLFMLVDGKIPAAAANFTPMRRGKGFNERVEFSREELGRVSSDIRSLFTDRALACQLYTNAGHFADNNWMTFEDVVITRSEVQWLDPSSRFGTGDVTVDTSQGVFLTCFLPTLLLSVVMITVIYRIRKQW
jgi:hypothetical protein